MTKFAIQLGKAVYVGEGKNIWPHVYIDEGAEAVILRGLVPIDRF